MTDHPLTEARAAELWNDVPRSVVAFEWEDMNAEEMGHARAAMRATFDAGREHEREHEREHADPHHDPRPWQDCALKHIRAGDLVEAQEDDILHVGIAHRQDADGDWWTKDGHLLTHSDNWPLRRIPAPTPPAEEVELPTEFGAIITDVEADFGEAIRFDRMVWTGWRWTYRDHSTTSGFIHAFTLPDGTRARRDGEREDGTPRFVKEDA